MTHASVYTMPQHLVTHGWITFWVGWLLPTLPVVEPLPVIWSQSHAIPVDCYVC